MIEPLKQEPESITPKGIDGNIASHALANYTRGFHDGAYALAGEILLTLPDADENGNVKLEDVKSMLRSYEQRDARPCAGWDHEPNKPLRKSDFVEDGRY